MHPKLSDWKTKGQYITFNNLNIFYRLVGKGKALLIFHGYPYSGFDFEKVIANLSQQFTVIIPDMPGMGFSDKPKNHHYSFEEMANMYTTLLQKLSITDIHILAHDLGNSVVQELLVRDQEKSNPFNIHSIVFLNGGLFSDVYKPRLIQKLLSKSHPAIGSALSKLMTKGMVLKATDEVFGKNTKPTPELKEIFWEVLNYNNGKALAYLLGRLIFEKDKYQHQWINAMQKTNIAMCFINGPADPNSGLHMAKRYEELIVNSQVYLLSEHIGHWPQLEAPEETLQAFYSFHSKL